MSWEDTIEDDVETTEKEETTSSWEDTIEDDVDTEPSRIDALGRGALQGASLGFSDELGAAIATPIDKLMAYVPGTIQHTDKQLREAGFTGDIEKEKDLIETYRELRDQARAKDVAAKEAHPGTFLAGEVAGGIAPALATGGSALMGTAGKTALKEAAKAGVRKSGQEITKEALKREALKAAAKQSAKGGAIFGGAYGLGAGEADITEGEVLPAIQETAIGAGTGGIMGALTPVAGEGIKKGAGYLKGKTDALRREIVDTGGQRMQSVVEAFKRAEAGKPVTGTSVFKEAEKGLEKLANEVSDFLIDSQKAASKGITKGLKGKRVRVKDLINKYEKKLSQFDKKALTEEDQKAVQFFKDSVKVLKERSMKEVPSKKYTKLPTETEARKLMEKAREQELMASEFLPPEEKALQKGITKIAKKDVAPEDVIADPRRAVFEQMDAERELLDFQGPGKKGEIESILKEAVDPEDIGDIQKLEAPGGTEYLGYRRGTKAPKIQEVRGEIPFGEKKIQAQELYDIQKQMQQAIPEKSPAAGDLAKFQKGVKEDILEKVGEEGTDLVKKGFDIHKQIHETAPLIGKNLTDRMSQGNREVAITKLIKDMGLFSELSRSDLAEGRNLDKAMEFIRKINPEFADRIKKEGVDLSKMALLSGEAEKMGMGLRTSKTLETAGIWAGTVSGKVARKAGQTGDIVRGIANLPQDALLDLSQRANRIGRPKIANFLSNMADKDGQGKSALVFSAMQNPETKKALMETLGIAKEEEK